MVRPDMGPADGHRRMVRAEIVRVRAMGVDRLITAARNFVVSVDENDGDVWGNFTCPEIDEVAELAVAVGRPDVAATVIVRHSHVDEVESGDWHAEIGDARRRDDSTRGVEWTEREAYRLASAYVDAMS